MHEMPYIVGSRVPARTTSTDASLASPTDDTDKEASSQVLIGDQNESANESTNRNLPLRTWGWGAATFGAGAVLLWIANKTRQPNK
jgi:hypothetical protein